MSVCNGMAVKGGVRREGGKGLFAYSHGTLSNTKESRADPKIETAGRYRLRLGHRQGNSEPAQAAMVAKRRLARK